MKYGKDFHLVAAPKMVTPEPTPKSRRAFWTDEEVQRLQVRGHRTRIFGQNL